MSGMDDFSREFQRVLTAANEWGALAHPLQHNGDRGLFRDDTHRRRFLASCHRGYQKAQDYIISLLEELAHDTVLPEEDRLYRELILRRVIDGIAFVMLNLEFHVARRLVLHNSPPALNLTTVRTTQREANRLNNESRLTFALIADLTTFIHVADLLRVDFRHARA